MKTCFQVFLICFAKVRIFSVAAKAEPDLFGIILSGSRLRLKECPMQTSEVDVLLHFCFLIVCVLILKNGTCVCLYFFI